MDVRQLRSFVAIAEGGSFSGAAVTLGITQQALSLQIANLETELGTSLLIRGARGVTLRPSGRVLLDHARAILRQLDQASVEVRQLGKAPEGTVTLGMPVTVTEMLSVPLLLAVEREFPGIRVQLIEGLGTKAVEGVRSGRLDLALVPEIKEVEGLAAEPLLVESLYIVGCPGAFSRDERLPVERLCDFPLILPTFPHNLRVAVEDCALTSRIRLQIKNEVEGLPLIKALVRAGYAHSVMTHAALRTEYERGELSAALLGSPPVTRALMLVSSHDRPMTAPTTEVRRVLRTMIRSLVGDGTWSATLAPALAGER